MSTLYTRDQLFTLFLENTNISPFEVDDLDDANLYKFEKTFERWVHTTFDFMGEGLWRPIL